MNISYYCDLQTISFIFQSASQIYRIEAMPTFIFLKNNAKVDELRGANPHKLEELVMRWAGTADELVGICADIKFVMRYPLHFLNQSRSKLTWLALLCLFRVISIYF